MLYPLHEEIGDPDLFVGRKKELFMLKDWIKRIPKKLSKSKAIFSRKKGGKTALVQRIFNELWSENGQVIPFFFSVSDAKIWLPNLASYYYQLFISQYISFIERDTRLVTMPLSMNKILEYAKSKSIDPIIQDIESLIDYEKKGYHDLMWNIACTAPKRFAGYYNIRFLVIIDEFQYLSKYIYRDEGCKKYLEETLPGTYHSLAESKMASMLITGSYTNWLNSIVGRHLEGGRVSKHFFSPYLEHDEGLEAVHVYSKAFEKKITEKTAQHINQLCYSDPFFISSVVQSKYEKQDLKTTQGVIDTIYFEISNRQSDMSIVWREYIDNTLKDINNIHAKRILLHLSKNPKRIWIPIELKEELHLEISEQAILERLRKLEKADLIQSGVADIEFQGINDGTLHLILRSRYGREIKDFEPDIRVDFQSRIQAKK